LISFEADCREQLEKESQGRTVRTHLRERKISDRGNILIFDKGVGLDLRNEPQGRAQSQLIEAERMFGNRPMACSISHDMRQSLSAIYANAEVLERSVSFVVDKAVAAVKLHPDGRNVSVTVGKFPPAGADIDARNLECHIRSSLSIGRIGLMAIDRSA
jgi:signal transduction histidine kinase